MSTFISDQVPEIFDADPSCPTTNVALTAFFLRSVITPRRLQTVTGIFEELPIFYFKTVGTDSPLQQMTLACASAAYGIRHNSAAALTHARATYSVAITQLSKDVAAFLGSGGAGVAILIIALCNFYEFIMCLKEDRSFRHLHEKGLISLLRDWSLWESCQNSTDRRLLEAARHYVANDCLESRASASAVLGQATSTLDLNDSDFGRLLTRCVIRTADIAASTSKLYPQSAKEDVLWSLEQAQEIDKDLQQWTRRVPAHWKFTRHRNLSWPSEYALDYRCDAYYDLQVAANWNCYRRTRLILLEVMISLVDAAYSLGTEDLSSLRQRSLETMAQLSEDLCASVPFNLGTRTTKEEHISFPSTSDEEADAVRDQMAPVHGWFLIVLPIRRLMKTTHIPEAHHAWIAVQYRRICAIVARKHSISVGRAYHLLDTAIPAFASLLPINSRHIRSVSNVSMKLFGDLSLGLMHGTPDQDSHVVFAPNSSRHSGESNTQCSEAYIASPKSGLRMSGEPRCWDHGCEGKKFANWSNLERHCKERDKAKWTCMMCGASFTRRSARRTHMQYKRCGSSLGRPRKLSTP